MPSLPTRLDVLERHEEMQLTPEYRAHLLAMREAVADRLLRSQRMHKLRGIEPGTLVLATGGYPS